MAVMVSRHIFKSGAGDGTLAKSADITASELGELEDITFGQTDEENYIQSLWPEPAYLCRRLKSSRWAITRVLPDEDETSLLFVSALVSHSDWFEKLDCDIDAILYNKELWHWNADTEVKPVVVSPADNPFGPSDEIRQQTLELLRAVEANKTTGQTIIVSEKEFSHKAFRWLNMILPCKARENFSYAVRTLTDGLKVSIVSISDYAAHSQDKPKTIFWYRARQISGAVYADAVEELWHSGQMPPIDVIQRCKDFRPDFNTSPVSVNSTALLQKTLASTISKPALQIKTSPRPKSKPKLTQRLKRTISAVLVVFIVMIMVWLGVSWGLEIKRDMEISDVLKQGQNFLSDNNPAFVFESNIATKPLIVQCRQLQEQAGRLKTKYDDKRLNVLLSEFAKWQNKIVSANAQQIILDNLFGEFSAIDLEAEIAVYPEPALISNVDRLTKELKKNQSAFIVPSQKYIDQAQAILRQVKNWNTQVEESVQKIVDDANSLTAKVEQLNEPTFYSDEILNRNDQLLDSIEKFLADNGLINAARSPRLKDLQEAANVLTLLTTEEQKINDWLNKLNSLKNTAQAKMDQAAVLLSKSSDSDIPQRIKDAQQGQRLLNESGILWPGNKQIAELADKLATLELVADADKIRQKLLELYDKAESIKTDSYSIEEYQKLQNVIAEVSNLLAEFEKIDLEKLQENQKIHKEISDGFAKLKANLSDKEKIFNSMAGEFDKIAAKVRQATDKVLSGYQPGTVSKRALINKYILYLNAVEEIKEAKSMRANSDKIEKCELELEKWKAENSELIYLVELNSWLAQLEKLLKSSTKAESQKWREQFENKSAEYSASKSKFGKIYSPLTTSIELKIIRISRFFDSQQQ